MFQQDSHHSAQKDGLLAPVALVIAALIALQTVLALTGPAPVTEGLLQGPDSYMRLNRVIQLWQTGTWFDPVYHRIDPPAGHIQHWTRPMDLVLLAGAAVAAPFVGFEAGLYGWAVAVNPVLHIAALFAVLWAAAAIIERRWLWLVPMLFIVQPGIFSAFMVARPDHQGLIVLTVIGFVGASLRLLRTPSRGRVAVAAGVLTALALWISIETLIVVVPAIAVLGLKWLAGSRSHDATPARAIAQLSAAAALVAATALVVEHGPRWLDRAYDTLSLAHAALFALTAILWALLAHMAPGHPVRRIVFAVAAAAVGGAILWLVFPGFFASPLANVDPLYRATRLEKIHEIQPMVSSAAVAVNGLATELARVVMLLGQGLVGIAWAVWQIGRAWRGNAGAGRPVHLWAWIFLGLGLALFSAMALGQMRWMPYAALFSLLVYAHLAATLLTYISSRLGTRRLTLVRPLVVVALAVWPFAPLIVLSSQFKAATAQVAAGHCDLRAAAAFLADPSGLGARPQKILAFVDSGPELLYRTPHSVLSIPNHRPQPGFGVSYRAMTATDFETARAELARTNVDLVLVCGAGAALAFYGSRADPAELVTLHEALIAGTPPAFLRPIALPDIQSDRLRLYRVAN